MIDNYDEIDYIKRYVKTGEFINSRCWVRDAGLFVRWMKNQGFSKKDIKDKLIKTCKKMKGFDYDYQYELIAQIISRNWNKHKDFIKIEKVEVPVSVINWIKGLDLKKNELKILFTLYVWARIQDIYYEKDKSRRIYWYNDKIFLKKASNMVNSWSLMNTIFKFEKMDLIVEYEGSAILNFMNDNFIFHNDNIHIEKHRPDHDEHSIIASSLITDLSTKDKFIISTEELYNLGNWIWDVISDSKVPCERCGRPIENIKNKLYCTECSKHSKTPMKVKIKTCVICGNTFEASSKNNSSKPMCEKCKTEYKKKKDREKALKYYYKNRNK